MAALQLGTFETKVYLKPLLIRVAVLKKVWKDQQSLEKECRIECLASIIAGQTPRARSPCERAPIPHGWYSLTEQIRSMV